MVDHHAEALLRLCRICGENLSRHGRVTHSCLERKSELSKAFHITIDDDKKGIHPNKFCNSCYSKIKNKTRAIRNNSAETNSLLFEYSIVWLLFEKAISCANIRLRPLFLKKLIIN